MSGRERPGDQAGPGQLGDTGQPEPPDKRLGDRGRKEQDREIDEGAPKATDDPTRWPVERDVREDVGGD
jgi:hypothetical protein